MPAALFLFSNRFVGRNVVDLFIDDTNGTVLGLLLELDEGLDPKLLPWSTFGEFLVVPTDEVASIDEEIHLNR